MKKRIIIYLSMSPEDGGKFQYSISLLGDLSVLQNEATEITALFFSDHWQDYINKFSIHGEKISNKESLLYSKLRTLIYGKLLLLKLWRVFNRYCSKKYRKMKTLNPELVFYPGNDSLAYEFDLPSVVPIFDLMHRYENFPEVKEYSIYESRERHYKNLCKYAKEILVDSELGKKHVIDCYDVVEKKITVYPYQPPYYVYDYYEIDVIKKYNLPADYFFYPAQFWEHKNHRVIIEAVKLLKGKGEIINFVFVGGRKNGYEKVVELINNYGLQNHIIILGYVTNDELVSLYKRAKALVFPSLFGPTNIPPLEALALNCPVIVSDVYSHRDQLEDKVIYFNPRNAMELADKLIIFNENYYFIKNKKYSVIKNNLDHADKNNALKKILVNNCRIITVN